MNKRAQIFKDARSFIEKGWTQGAYTRDENGWGFCNQREAVCWCSEGALFAARASVDEHQLLQDIVGDRVVAWNDTYGRTKDQVLAAFDRAIELARAAND